MFESILASPLITRSIVIAVLSTVLGHRRVKERETGSKISILEQRENAVLAARSTGKPTKNPGVR
ncbi:hypothetical protein [Bradyrhizobium paxllaeri]|uniref:hypothetical protein n=1 Tax=Bradyrhizobium paxllaeri TaxID=190148 RepID=UPI000A038146|nr:hypothetical protein [Bradyrhizobium paxllaeri]